MRWARPGSERTLQAPARRAIIVVMHTGSSSRSTREFIDVPFGKAQCGLLPTQILKFLQHVIEKVDRF